MRASPALFINVSRAPNNGLNPFALQPTEPVEKASGTTRTYEQPLTLACAQDPAALKRHQHTESLKSCLVQNLNSRCESERAFQRRVSLATGRASGADAPLEWLAQSAAWLPQKEQQELRLFARS